jgi:hypothetical protein
MADIIVKHKTFGEGKYVNIYGHYIEIQFVDGLKKFMFPNAFDNNMLETDDPWLINKIRQALNAVGKQHHVPRTVVSASSPRPNSKEVVRKIQAFSSSFIGDRSGFIDFNSDDELFEVVGYLAKPGRLAGIWAEIPSDDREADFKRLFPRQPYMPITMTTTPSGRPSKFSPQFRINLANITNCPDILIPAIGKGLGSSIVGRINKSKFVVQLVHFFGFQFGDMQNISAIKNKVAEYGYTRAFNRGYNR